MSTVDFIGRVIIRLKGGPGSGWFAPGKGTHTGEKHRQVGSGKAVAGKKVVEAKPSIDLSKVKLVRRGSATYAVYDEKEWRPVVKGKAKLQGQWIDVSDLGEKIPVPEKPVLPLVDAVQDVSSGKWGGQMSTKGYYIRSDGKLLDTAPAATRGGGEHKDVMENYPHMLGGISDSALQERDTYTSAGDWAALADWEIRAWESAVHRGVVRVRSTPTTVEVEGLPLNRAGVTKFQGYVLDGKLPDVRKGKYIWFPVGAGKREFTWAELMQAKYPRDLKDMIYKDNVLYMRIISGDN